MRLKFREEKATQAAVYLLSRNGGSMSHMKLIKLLYLAEREALLRWGRPITFDTYMSMDHGPVLSLTLNKINSDLEPGNVSYWHTYITERVGHEVSLVRDDVTTDALSDAEEQLLEEIFENFGHMTKWEIRDHTHTLPEWQDPEGSSVLIQIRDILLTEGLSDDDVRQIEEAIEAEDYANRVLV